MWGVWSCVFEVVASFGVVGVFAVLACGGPVWRRYRRRRRGRSRPKTRPTIPHLVAIPRTREW